MARFWQSRARRGKRQERAEPKIKINVRSETIGVSYKPKIYLENHKQGTRGARLTGGTKRRGHRAQGAPSAGGTDLPFSLNMPKLNLAYWANPILCVYLCFLHATRAITIGLTENFFRLI